LEQRKRRWAREIESAIQELQSKYQILIQELADDPLFVTALTKATSAALATHQKEKICALRKFLVSVGARRITDDELQNVILRLLDDLSVGHFEILCFLEQCYRQITPKDSLEAVFELYQNTYQGKFDRMSFRWMLADLSNRMVVHLGDLEDMNEFKSMTETLSTHRSKIRPLQITKLGYELLNFLRKNEPCETNGC
jgi:hypothetical protein